MSNAMSNFRRHIEVPATTPRHWTTSNIYRNFWQIFYVSATLQLHQHYVRNVTTKFWRHCMYLRRRLDFYETTPRCRKLIVNFCQYSTTKRKFRTNFNALTTSLRLQKYVEISTYIQCIGSLSALGHVRIDSKRRRGAINQWECYGG